MSSLTILQTHIFYAFLIAFSAICIWLAAINQQKTVIAGINGKPIDVSGLLFFIVSFVVLLIPLVSRSCGADTPQYYKTYVSDDTAGLDFTFYFLCKSMHSIIKDPKIGLGIISAVTLFLAYYSFLTVKNRTEIQYAFLAYYTGMYFYLYNYMRIMVATAFVFVCYACLLKEKKIKALAFAGIAVLFHRSAVVVLLMVLIILAFKKHKRLVTFVGLLGVAAVVLRPYFFLNLITIERYSSYMSSATGSSVGFGTTVKILPFFLVLYYYRRYKEEFVYTSTLYLLIANLAFSFLGYIVDSASRLSNMYFVFHITCFMPWLFKQEENRGNKATLLKVFFILYCGLNYYMITANFDAMMIMPYTW